jgi:hypothetical protein
MQPRLDPHLDDSLVDAPSSPGQGAGAAEEPGRGVPLARIDVQRIALPRHAADAQGRLIDPSSRPTPTTPSSTPSCGSPATTAASARPQP